MDGYCFSGIEGAKPMSVLLVYDMAALFFCDGFILYRTPNSCKYRRSGKAFLRSLKR
jgi:hypothetical protein